MAQSLRTLGQYTGLKRIAAGGFAEVYAGRDSVSGVAVALKLPRPELMGRGVLDDFRKEARLVAEIEHPNILPVKTAGMVDGRFVIVQPLGAESLADRLQRRIATKTALDLGEQFLAGLAFAHERRILHGDVKPDNLILFHDGRLRLADFGIARVALRTLRGSGSGTVGYAAPEQAMGRPSLRSDVFSAGLVLYRMLAGVLPEWPFRWPPPRFSRLRARVSPAMVEVLSRALAVEPSKRFRDAGAMLTAFKRARRKRAATRTSKPAADWKQARFRQFRREHGKTLAASLRCVRCDGPVSAAMSHCPWCRAPRPGRGQEAPRGYGCPRCKGDVKGDWRYCAHCYGPAIGPVSTRASRDARYVRRCANRRCPRGLLLPFSRYCPWCRRKAPPWPVPGRRTRCTSCGWGVLPEYWAGCPWCGGKLDGGSA